MNGLLRLQGTYDIDEYRHSVERIGPDAYLAATSSTLVAGVERLLREKGVPCRPGGRSGVRPRT